MTKIIHEPEIEIEEQLACYSNYEQIVQRSDCLSTNSRATVSNES